MKKSHYVAALLLVLLPAAAGLLIWTPLGRMAERAGTRLAGDVRWLTDNVYPRPLVLLRVWRQADEPAFRAEVYRSGLLVLYWNGKHEKQLPNGVVDRLFVLAQVARGDFGAHGCGDAPDGINADLYVLMDGHWSGTSCRQSSSWPTGAETRRLLTELRTQLPEGIRIPTRSHDRSPEP